MAFGGGRVPCGLVLSFIPCSSTRVPGRARKGGLDSNDVRDALISIVQFHYHIILSLGSYKNVHKADAEVRC